MESRESAGFLASFFLAIPCGLLMYCAVTAKDNLRLFYIIMCVSAFILGGFYHCIADMFYTFIGAISWKSYVHILIVTAGNLLGCNIIPLFKKLDKIIKM